MGAVASAIQASQGAPPSTQQPNNAGNGASPPARRATGDPGHWSDGAQIIDKSVLPFNVCSRPFLPDPAAPKLDKGVAVWLATPLRDPEDRRNRWTCGHCGKHPAENNSGCSRACYNKFVEKLDLIFEHLVTVTDTTDPNMGFGVFAKVPFHKGERLAQYKGQLGRGPIPSDDDVDTSFCLELGHVKKPNGGDDGSRQVYIDALRHGDKTRYINHSCQPNLVAYTEWLGDIRVAMFAVLRDIKAGEQLSFHYGNNYFEEMGIKCRCDWKPGEEHDPIRLTQDMVEVPVKVVETGRSSIEARILAVFEAQRDSVLKGFSKVNWARVFPGDPFRPVVAPNPGPEAADAQAGNDGPADNDGDLDMSDHDAPAPAPAPTRGQTRGRARGAGRGGKNRRGKRGGGRAGKSSTRAGKASTRGRGSNRATQTGARKGTVDRAQAVARGLQSQAQLTATATATATAAAPGVASAATAAPSTALRRSARVPKPTEEGKFYRDLVAAKRKK